MKKEMKTTTTKKKRKKRKRKQVNDEMRIVCFLIVECLDEEDLGMLDMDNDPGSSSGCTAVVTILRDKQLLVANAGDSRCVVCRAGQAVEMSVGQSYSFSSISITHENNNNNNHSSHI